MFDKLIESNTVEAEFKPRRSYFLVSTVVVGILFVTAVVISIYAGEIGIGNGDLELSEILAPVETAAIEPERPQPRTQQPNQATSDRTTRVVNQQRIEEQPITAPPVSTTPNSHLSRPLGEFSFDKNDSGPATPTGTGRDPNGTGDPNSTGLSNNSTPRTEDPGTETPPPTIKPKAAVSGGVVNGNAIYLPKPTFPAAATTLKLQGKVDVQVTIDETGKVISAKAASGHPLLRPAAEKAAWGAKFKPTTLTGVPVKVTGVIVYNFTQN